MKKLLHDQNGMTLVEILVAMVLMSLVMLTAFSLLSNGIGVNDKNNIKTLALNLAEERMEFCKYSIPLSWDGSTTDLESPTLYNRENQNFTAKVTAEKYTDTTIELHSGTLLAQITVRVWTKDQNNPEAVLKSVVKVKSGM